MIINGDGLTSILFTLQSAMNEQKSLQNGGFF